MKLSNLSFAVIMALGVVACGGSGGDGNQTVPESPAPAPEPAPAPDASTHDSTLVDPTRTHVVDDRDLLKEVTVGSLQYVRRDGSDYDRNYNPEQRASSTPLLGVSLNEQNPKLTNIVLARQDLLRADGQPVRAQFAGGLSPEPLSREGRPQEIPSLQIENYQNVDILAGAFKQFGSAAAHTNGTAIDSYAFGDKFDYDTHVQDNIDKSGEHTRERVSHNYTIRYEYKQPYVDYPNAVNPAHNYQEWPDGTDPATRAPVAPQNGLAWMEANLKGSADWITKDENIHSRHPVNTGFGGSGTRGGTFSNIETRFGNLVGADAGTQGDAANWAPAHSWRNVGFDPNNPNAFAPIPPHTTANNRGDHWIAPLSDADRTKKWLVDWSSDSFKGSINRGGSCVTIAGECGIGANNQAIWSDQTYDYTQYYPNGVYPGWVDLGTAYSYRTIYPDWMHKRISGYPSVNAPYNESRNNTLTDQVTPAGNPHYHEHIYLEQEEFSAIRTPELLRPLKNPIPHEWKWELYQTWHSTYPLKVEHYEIVRYDVDPITNVRTPVYDWVDRSANHRTILGQLTGDIVSGTREIYHADNLAGRFGGAAYSGTTSVGGIDCSDTASYRCTVDYSKGTANVWLATSRWQNPQNMGGGETGEFRGPWYWGWDDNSRTIRYNDERIWKPGTPGYKPEYERKYGANLIWWSTQDSAFENYATAEGKNPRARRVDVNTSKNPAGLSEDLVWAQGSDNGTNARDNDVEIQPTGDITNGLIRIGGGMATLGEELKWDDVSKSWKDHHNTTSRIFGRYHLAYADQEKGEIKPVSLNSYQGARSFVARVKDRLNGNGYRQGNQTFWADLESEAEKYSIGAQPMTLKKVQYGRVTTNLDLDMGEGPHDGGFLQAPFAYKNDGAAVDNYFYRGIDATSLEQMAAVTANNGMARYEGHALMYGIDNAYKGITEIKELSENAKPLPNAFSIPDHGTPDVGTDNGRLGLGNFVQAEVNFGTKKVSGEVYNAWLLDQNKAAVTKDLLVHFKGDIMGNTVIGSADRTYIKGDDKADFRASFFGEKAEEMGGAFNSVTREQKYGSAYEDGDWGGVFGAKQVGSGNTFQGDDGANVYNGL